MDGTGNERGQEHPGIRLNMLGRVGQDVQVNREPVPPPRLLKPLNKAAAMLATIYVKALYI